jgi:hypothetical protein
VAVCTKPGYAEKAAVEAAFFFGSRFASCRGKDFVPPWIYGVFGVPHRLLLSDVEVFLVALSPLL